MPKDLSTKVFLIAIFILIKIENLISKNWGFFKI